MGRLLKILAGIFAALAVLVVFAIFILTRVIDPNDFKPRIADLAQQQANLVLHIPGQIEWRFWPTLGLSMGRTEARIAGEEELFAAFDSARVGVAIIPLLRQRVTADEVRIQGLYLDLVDGADGANWEKVGSSSGQVQKSHAAEDSGAQQSLPRNQALDISLLRVALEQGRIRYRNRDDGTDILVEHLDVVAEYPDADAPFPLSVRLRYQDQRDIRVDLVLSSIVSLNLPQQHYTLDPMQMDLTLGGLTPDPVEVSISQRLTADFSQGLVSFQELVASAAGLQLSGDVEVSGLNAPQGIQFTGHLSSRAFSLPDTLQTLGQPAIETRNPNALRHIVIDARLAGPANSLMLDPLNVTLDRSNMSGKAGIKDLNQSDIFFSMIMDALRLDDYLPPPTDEKSTPDTPGTSGTAAKAPLSDQPLLPLAALRALQIDGALTIAHLQTDELSLQDLTSRLSAEKGVIETSLLGRTLDGQLQAEGALDVRTEVPQITLTTNIDNIEIAPLARLVLGEDLFFGSSTLNMQLKTAGNSEKTLMENIDSDVDLGLTDGSVRGVNLHNTLIDGINEMLGSEAAFDILTARLDTDRLPRELREDTQILDLVAETRMEGLVAYVDRLDATLDRGAHVNGKGWLNVYSEDFDISLAMRAPGLIDIPRLSDRTWTLRCAGNLNKNPAHWCLPDKAAFRKAGKDLAARLLREKAREKLGVDLDQLDGQLRDKTGATAKKVETKIDKEVERAQKKVREELERLLR